MKPKNNWYVTRRQYILLNISRSILGTTNVSDKSCRENQNRFYVQKMSFEKCAVDEIIWKNILELGRPQMTIWHMRIACWIPKPTNIFSEYEIHIAFPIQKWLYGRASMIGLCFSLISSLALFCITKQYTLIK